MNRWITRQFSVHLAPVVKDCIGTEAARLGAPSTRKRAPKNVIAGKHGSYRRETRRIPWAHPTAVGEKL